MQLIPTLADLVALPSISSVDPSLDRSNRPVAEYLAPRLEDMGFHCELQPVTGDKVNLVATLGSGPGGLVLSGHTDTVPFDAGRWQSDPFTLTETDGRLVGLGSSDMKGFFAVALQAIEELMPLQVTEPLIVLATADEETSMSGARALAASGQPRARYAVIGEPTNLKPVHMHKGVMMESVRLVGRSGHSSNPALGASALDAMHKVLGALMTLREQWGKRYNNPGFDVAVPTLNLASMHGGDAPNRICGHCELRFDVRMLPGMQSDEVRAVIRQTVSDVLAQDAVRPEFESLIEAVDAFAQSRDSELVKLAEQLSGYQATSAAFATEAPFLQAMGMQTVVLGPGSIDCAHQPNEYIDTRQLKPAIKLLKRLIQHYCCEP